MDRTRVSKQMAYLLRHNPSGMRMDEEGFVCLSDLLDRLRERWPDMGERELRRIVAEDSKGRYEICNGRVRARYGHSLDVNPTLPEADADRLYHGTTAEAAHRILEVGLESAGRQRVHLSATPKGARMAGLRRSESPVVLLIDAKAARGAGIRIERASDAVFVTESIPPAFVSYLHPYRRNNFH